MGVTIDKRHVVWQPCWRIVPSRFPPIDLFERIADPADWDALIALESLTNDRIRDEVGDIALVPVAERISGPGSSVIMAAFTHPNPDGSRFSDGSRRPVNRAWNWTCASMSWTWMASCTT
jgi:hypothetical protein